ncbi:MAG: ComF family protein [Acidobacteriota bacterium]|nr:ComF family protein [Acidobacteriota bacterium]
MRGKGRDRQRLTAGSGAWPRLRAAGRLGTRLAELLIFPSACRLCGRLLDEPGERVLCRACLAGLAPLRGPACPRCGRSIAAGGESYPCGACRAAEPPFSRHRSAGAYGGTVKEAILLFKFRKFRPLAKPLAAFVVSSLGDERALWEEGVFVPVPLHRKRRRERGFNQAAALAGEMGRLTGRPVEARALRRIADIPPQTTMGKAERKANVRGAFRVVHPERIRGRVVVLVDDVFTTGSTLGECARVLRRAGAADVRALTVARA